MSLIGRIARMMGHEDQHHQHQQRIHIVGLNEALYALADAIRGKLSPSDQALLDALDKRSERIVRKLQALDAKTPAKPAQ